jgi:hypothetical protein
VLEKLVDALQVASILSAAAFAALALFTNHKQDGRITRYGRFAVLGIVLSALFSLGMQWSKDEIDRRKAADARIAEAGRERAAAKAAADELDRYRRQMNGLSSLLGLQQVALDGTRRLVGRMQVSLRQQEAIQAQARGTLLAVEATRSQEKANTIRVLKRMWDEANRIPGSRVEVMASTHGDLSSGADTPFLLDGAMATLMLLDDREVAADARGELKGSRRPPSCRARSSPSRRVPRASASPGSTPS